MKLKATKKLGKHPGWCGPMALSALSGRSVNHCARLIAKERNGNGWYRGKGTGKQVRGTHTGEIRRALEAMGLTMTKINIPRHRDPHQVIGGANTPPTLRRYMSERGGEQWKNSMLVQVSNHWVVTNKDTVSDFTGTSHYSKHEYRLKKVHAGYIVRTKPKK